MSKYNYYLSGWITHLASCTTTKADIWIRGLNRFDPAYNAAYLTNMHPYNSETAQRNKPESIWPSYNAVNLTDIASLQACTTARAGIWIKGLNPDNSEEQAKVDLTQLQCSLFVQHYILTTQRQLRGTSQSRFDPATMQSIWPTLHPCNFPNLWTSHLPGSWQLDKPKSIWPSLQCSLFDQHCILTTQRQLRGTSQSRFDPATMQSIWLTLHPYKHAPLPGPAYGSKA